MAISQTDAEERAKAYANAWNSHVTDSVASLYAEDGRITINDGDLHVGRAQISGMAAGFIEEFPGLKVHMDDFRSSGTHGIFRWTLEGHATGHGGSGNYVKLSEWEYWRYAEDRLVAESMGHFDTEDSERQWNGR